MQIFVPTTPDHKNDSGRGTNVYLSFSTVKLVSVVFIYVECASLYAALYLSNNIFGYRIAFLKPHNLLFVFLKVSINYMTNIYARY